MWRLRWRFGQTRLDKIKNDQINKKFSSRYIKDKIKGLFKWIDHVLCRLPDAQNNSK